MSTDLRTAPHLDARLRELYLERATAELHGLTRDPAYMADLGDEIAAVRNAYVGAAVTEIATLRAELSAPLAG
jgi:hypothetical protein